MAATFQSGGEGMEEEALVSVENKELSDEEDTLLRPTNKLVLFIVSSLLYEIPMSLCARATLACS